MIPKRIISVLTALLTMITGVFSFSSTASAAKFTPPFDLTSYAVYLMNLDEDSVIYEKNADEEQMPASLVNIMVAIIVLENCSNPDEVTITADKTLYWEFGDYEYKDDLRYGEIWDGDVLTVADYLYALMLTSSCEAANILADYFGDHNISSFVDKMNEKAKEIGAEHTVFANPHGLYDPKQVTTARDMAIITKYALTVPRFEEIAYTQEYMVRPVDYVKDHGVTWKWSHSNIIMNAASSYYLFGVKGIKTGNLNLTGRNIVTVGEYNGMKHLLVMLGAPLEDENGDTTYNHIIDAYKIMEWLFNNFEYKDLLAANEEVAEIKVDNADGNGYVLVKPEKTFSALWYNEVDVTSIQRKYNLYENVSAPVRKGQKLGEIELILTGETIAKVNLVAADDVEHSFVKFNLQSAKDFFGSKWMTRAIVISVLTVLLYTVICIWAYVHMKRNPKTGLSNKKIVKRLYGNKRK